MANTSLPTFRVDTEPIYIRDDDDDSSQGPIVVEAEASHDLIDLTDTYYADDVVDLTQGFESLDVVAMTADEIEERMKEGFFGRPLVSRKSRRPTRPWTAREPRIRKSGRQSYPLDGFPITDEHWLMPGEVVELRGRDVAPGRHGDFLKIRQIYEDNGEVYLRGILYRRTCVLEGIVEKKINEVAMILQHDIQDGRDILTQSLHDVNITDVVKGRRLLHTNRSFPEDSFRGAESVMGMSIEDVKARLRLTCRWKRIKTYSCEVDLQTGYPQEWSMERITKDACDPGCGAPDVILRRAVTAVEETSIINLDLLAASSSHHRGPVSGGRETRTPRSRPTTRYSFADFFCGAGGASIGARQAGLDIVYGVDMNEDACNTFRLNFPEARVFQEEIFDHIVRRLHAHAIVRVIHISNVCKVLSPAYTVQGKHHEENLATLFCISQILKKVKPMVATLEQTFGASRGHNQVYLRAFINQFTSVGYSVRWAVHDLSEYGVPQRRKRLVMIAACAGHPLPEFPKPTHGPGLRRYATIADAINPIRMGMPNHDPATAVHRDCEPYSPYKFLKGCITTSGGIGNYHPSGTRGFTPREFASLQTFPMDHEFLGQKNAVITQVGNAFPPAYTKLLFESVRKTLEEVDLEDAEYDREFQERLDRGSQERPIVIDDDDDDEAMDQD